MNRYFFIFILIWIVTKGTAQNSAVLLIHGMAGRHTTWDELITSFHSSEYLYMGNFEVNRTNCMFTSSGNGSANAIHTKAHLVFSIDFSDNQNLSFNEQGDEVHLIIERIIKDFPVDKVVLMAHSMGGLAARAYIMNYGEGNIAGLITVSTPHLGSYLGYLRELNKSCKMINPNAKPAMINFLRLTIPAFHNYYCDLSKSLDLIGTLYVGLDIDSKAVSYLEPDSEEMLALYKQIFPKNLPVVNVISNWEVERNMKKDKLESITISMQQLNDNYISEAPINIASAALQIKYTDGIVSVPAQYMKMAVINGNDITIKTIYTNRFHEESNKDIPAMMQSLNYVFSKNTSSKKASIAFIIDSSGSMGESDPSNIRKSALEQIVRSEDDIERIFVVDFDDDALWINSDNYENRINIDLVNSIRTIDANGGTNIGKALSFTSELFDKLMISEDAAVVLLSDGLGDYHNESQWFKDHNIPIFTISLLGNTNEDILNSIADFTKGKYYKAYNEFDIIDAYFSILKSHLPYAIIYNTDNKSLKPGEKSVESFFVEPAMSKMIIRLFYENHIPNFNIIQPNGTLLSIASLKHLINDNYAFVEIPWPCAGGWQVQMESESTSISTNFWKLLVMGATNSDFQICSDFNEGSNQVELFPVVTDLSNEYHINKQYVKVYSPTGTVSNSENYSLPMFLRLNNGHGSYKIDIHTYGTIDGLPFQRYFTYSLYIKGGGLTPPTIKESYGNIALIELIGQTQNIGDKCYIYSLLPKEEVLIGKGRIVNIGESSCVVEFSELDGKITESGNYSIFFTPY
ncbi:MAG: VWA domain-containing protein [Bacteroidales bacterium]|nr:VWA domain-containing protein [Bacteroidales bacterium]